MNYIIFDLEWNQSADERSAISQPVYLAGEIIEIGAVKLDENFRITDELRLYISPVFYPKMHKRIATLTGIHDRDLAEKGIPFPQAYRQFLDWCGSEFTFMTWSMSDLPVLVDNLAVHGMDLSGLPECCDIQRIFSREIMRSDTRYSLDTALAVLREKGDTAHDALNDARNTAKICDHLELEEYLGEYVSRVYVPQPSGRLYSSRQQLLEDPSLLSFPCPLCGEEVRCESWVPIGGNTFLAYGLCQEEEPEFLLQLTRCDHGTGEFSAKQLLFEVCDDLWDIYMDHKESC